MVVRHRADSASPKHNPRRMGPRKRILYASELSSAHSIQQKKRVFTCLTARPTASLENSVKLSVPGAKLAAFVSAALG